jgi:hypothetical protein
MAQDAVRLSQYLALTVERHLEEDIVCIGDATADIGLADDDLVFVESPLALGRARYVLGHVGFGPKGIVLRPFVSYLPGTTVAQRQHVFATKLAQYI